MTGNRRDIATIHTGERTRRKYDKQQEAAMEHRGKHLYYIRAPHYHRIPSCCS